MPRGATYLKNKGGMGKMTKHGPLTRRDALKLAGGAAALGALTSAVPYAVQAAARMLGVSRPSIYRFKLGAFEVTNILDGYVQGPGPHPTFGNNQTPEAVQALVTAHGLPATRHENQFVVTLVNTGKELVLFDAGNPKGRAPTTGHLSQLIVTAGYQPEQVDVVVISHGHPDHVGGLLVDGKPVYPNARYVFGAREFDYWNKGENIPDARKGTRDIFMQFAAPLGEKAAMIKEDAEIVGGIRAIPAFGHSPGMLAFHIESEGKRLVNWADTANHYVLSVQQPDWYVAFDQDKDAAVATRRRIFDMVSADKLPVVGYHMPFPAVGWVEKTATSYRWVPATTQMNF
jgi:glyoxylase-like metal-dependent hydrolase (beta-lactamase superfamily II)